MKEFLNQIYFANSVLDYLIALGITGGGILLIKFIQHLIRKRLRGIQNVYTEYLLGLNVYAYPVATLTMVYGSITWLNMPEQTDKFIGYAFTVAFTFLLIRLVTAAVRSAIQIYLIDQDQSGEKLKQVRGIILILNGVLWIIGLIFLFDNLGFNVTAVLTGLGVGGIAIALAAQTILGDIFNYFVIFFDRPFELGDFIVVDDKLGVVEYIGLKTTRVKSLQGEQIVFSNSSLTNSRIHNFKTMRERRVLFKLGVVYDTSSTNLKLIPDLVKEAVESQGNTRFDRAHFSIFGDYSLNFEIVYYILSSDYNQYMDIQQAINLQLFEGFKKRGIEFAFPTYSIAMTKP